MIWSAAFVVFYFSCRCNVENFDLHYLAESIGAQPAEIGTGPAMARGTIMNGLDGVCAVGDGNLRSIDVSSSHGAMKSYMLAQSQLPPPASIRGAAREVISRPYYELDSSTSEDATPLLLEIIALDS